jgi:sugar phosphate permease
MTLTSKLDLTRPDRRGLTNGLNEFFGYFAVAVAGVMTGYLSDRLGARLGLLVFGLAAIIPALLMALLLVRESRERSSSSSERGQRTMQVVAMSFRDRGFFGLCQAGLVEKFIDVLMWLVLPVYLTRKGIDLKSIGWIPGVYAATWGCLQLVTGPLSDRVGRTPLIVGGMLACAVAIELFPMNEGAAWWSACAALAGIGMAMLYPTLGAAVSDFAPADWRGTALGVYRCWRDLGYAIGAALLCVPVLTGRGIGASFGLAAACVAVSAVVAAILSGASRRAGG